jgi:SAM-dependent methyltransferase
MSLSDDYKRQYAWRSWEEIFDILPSIKGHAVLDLGCAVGDQTAELVARGASVIGIDANEELLGEAQSRHLTNAEFRVANLRDLSESGILVDGLWCSFTAAYFPDLPSVLGSWGTCLRPGGWVSFTEIDDLFGHGPLSARSKSLLDAYAENSLKSGRYDFHMGSRLASHLERAGFTVLSVVTVKDRELAFRGPAQPDVVRAWRTRFERMTLLRDFCGSEFESVRDEFLDCLVGAGHRSDAKVYSCLAVK